MRYQARLEALFGGRVDVPTWREHHSKVNELFQELTGTTLPDETARGHQYHNPEFLPMEGGQIYAWLSFSSFEPCIAFPYDSYGFSFEAFYRGSKPAVAKAFDATIRKLGFPSQVTVGSYIPLFGKLLDIDPQEIPNRAGWNIAKEVVKNHNATLKQAQYTICRFPFSLFIRENDGVIIGRDGDILGNENCMMYDQYKKARIV